MIRLRAAEKSDLPRLFELDQVCFPAGIAYCEADFRWLLRSSQVTAVVAEEDELLAGFAIAQSKQIQGALAGQIVTLDVAPDFRRRGVGQILMDAIEVGLCTAGAESLRLEVAVDNSAALNFYRKRGFEAVGRIPGYYRANLDAIVMEKRLTGHSPNRATYLNS